MAKASPKESQGPKTPPENSEIEALKQMLRDTETFVQLKNIFNNLTTPQGRKEQGYSSQVDFIETLKKETAGWKESDDKEAAKLFIEEYGPQAKEVKKPKPKNKVEAAVEDLVSSGELDPRAEAPTVEVVNKATDDAIDQSKETGQPITLERYRQLIMDWFPRLAVRKGFEDRNTGKQYSNLDGNACLFLFREIFGFAKGTPAEQKYVGEEVEYVNPGSYKKGALNLDTSPGLHDIQFQDATFFVDHHGTESERQTSAFNILFEEFKRVGLDEQISPENRTALERLAQFVTYIDSYSLPQDKHWDSAWRDSHRTLYGVSLAYQNNISVEDLFEFFKHHDLDQAWSLDISQSNEPYLQKIKELAAEWWTEKQRTDQFVKNIDSIPNAGFAIETAKLGKILVQTQRTAQEKKRSLQFAALAHGYDGILVWEPNSKVFFLASGSDKEITPEIAGVVGEGVLIRKSMVKHSGPERKNTLESLLIALGASSESIPSALRQKNNQAASTMETTPFNPNTGDEINNPETASPVSDQETTQIDSRTWEEILDSYNGVDFGDLDKGFERIPQDSENSEDDLQPEGAETSLPVLDDAGKYRLKQDLEIAKEKFEIKKAEWEKYQGLVGMFRGRKLSQEERSSIYNEYQAALQEYAQKRAEYLADKSAAYLEDNIALAEGFQKAIAKNLERKFGGEARVWLEKIYAGYKKLGEWNLAKLFKIEEKMAAWQPETKSGKVGKVLANIGTRYLSVRTALSFGLLGGAFFAAGGLAAGGLLIGRRLLSSVGGFVGTNELWKGLEQVATLKEISQAKLAKLSNYELINQIHRIEAYCLFNGQKEFSGPGYEQLRAEYQRREERERSAQSEESFLEEGSEPTEAERQAEDNAQKIEERLSDLAEWIDSSATIKSFLDSQKEMEAIRLIGSSIMAGLLGSGALQIAFRELFGGTSPSDSAATKEALAAVTKLTAEQPVGGSNGAMSEAAQADWQAAIAKADQAIAESKANVAEIEGRISVLQEQNTINSHLQELATLHKGEGLIRVLQRQLEDVPERFGFSGDTTDTEAVHQWAQKTAASLSIKEGYWDPKTGDQVWVKWTDKEPISFRVINTDGNLSIEEQGTSGRTFIHHRTDAEQMLYNEKHAQLNWNEDLDKEYPAARSAGVVDQRTGLRISPKIGRGIDEDTLRQAAADRGDIQGRGVMESRSASSARFGDRGFIEPTPAEPDTTESIRVSSGAAEVGEAEPGAVEEPRVSEVVSGSEDQSVGAVSPAGAEQAAAAATESSVAGPEDFPEAVRPYATYLETKLQAAQQFAEELKNSSTSSPVARGLYEQVLLENDKFIYDIENGRLADYSGKSFSGYNLASARAELQYQFLKEFQPNGDFKIEIEPSAAYLLNNPEKLPDLAVQADNFHFQFTRNPAGGMGVLIHQPTDYSTVLARHNIATDSWINPEIRGSVENPNNTVTESLAKIDYLFRSLQSLENAGSGSTQAARVVREVLRETANETARQSGQSLDQLLTPEVFRRIP